MWKRQHLPNVPYIPTRKTADRQLEWYDETERDRLLDGIFDTQPKWYTFFYLTMRLGLRRGEVYTISRDRVREVPSQLVIDRAVQEGKGDRPALLVPRKNNRTLTLALTDDLVDAIRPPGNPCTAPAGARFDAVRATSRQRHVNPQLTETIKGISKPK